MSIEAMTVVLHHSKAQGRAKLVLLGIANHMGDGGAWPSVQTLAKYANASERSVQRDIRDLVELGELEVSEQSSPFGGQYRTNLYTVLVSCPDGCDGSFNHRSGVTDSTPGVTDGALRGDNCVTLTKHNLTEPTKEKQATRFNPDLFPTGDMLEWARINFPTVNAQLELQQFRDYWIAKGGANARKLDWPATWKNWVRNEAKRAPSRPRRFEPVEFDRAVADADRERRLKASEALRAEMEAARAVAAPAPRCEHGKPLPLCLPCSKRLAADGA